MRTNPVALITGCAGGIGRATAKALAEAGFDLVINDLSEDRLAGTAGDIRAAGRRAELVAGDITAASFPETLLAAALAAFGRVDGLVNNAGVSVLAAGDILDVSHASYDRCAEINSRAMFFLTQAVGRYFVATPPAQAHRFIVTITSANAVAVSITRSEYCVSKAAESMASRCFAARLAPHAVGVYEIRPGVIATEMTAPRLEGYVQRIQHDNLTAIPRVGQPEDVARCVCSLALGLLPYTVGQAIEVDGGLIMRRY